MLYHRWILLLLVLLSVQVSAEFKPFQTDSLKEIQERYQGQPFLLTLWSVECSPCLRELDMLSRWVKKHPGQNIVLISTDDISIAEEAWQLIRKYKLAKLDSWIFSDQFSERLRFNIDPNWHGELPRSYFYSSNHERRGHSGPLSEKMVKTWANESYATGL